MRGIEDVYHLASPMLLGTTPDEVVIPARDGASRLLWAARDAGARRVVLTSSFAAIGYSPKPVRDYTEDDWTDPSTPGLAAYPLSKTVAERAAWDFMEREGGDTSLVVINPTWIAGTHSHHGCPIVARGLHGDAQRGDAADSPAALRHRGCAGCRGPPHRGDEHPGGGRKAVPRAGEWADDDVPRRGRGAARPPRSVASRVPTAEAPGDEPAPLVIHNDRAKRELGFAPRPAEQTIVETAESLRELGLA